jgi:uncharacterized SAM-binding protein YcdF (DUF218 family)
MSLRVLIVLMLLALLFAVIRLRRTACVFLGLAALLFVIEGWGLLPAALLPGLQNRFAQRPAIVWKSRNAIVLLGSGTVHTPADTVEPTIIANGRILEAFALYRDCKTSGQQCKLEVSGGDALHAGKSEAAVYGALLERLGMPASDLLLESHSMNTWQNAEFSAKLLHAYHPQRVALVSSATHLRRASQYFRHFGLDVIPMRADWLTAHIGRWPSWWNFTVTDIALHEYHGLLRYRIYNAMGWNIHATKPGAA